MENKAADSDMQKEMIEYYQYYRQADIALLLTSYKGLTGVEKYICGLVLRERGFGEQ